MPHLQPPFHPQILHLPIAKFSHITTAIDHVGPLNWIHVQGNGELTCCFEKSFGSGSMPSRLIQKVLRGDDILEQLDLVFFVRMVAMQAAQIPPPKSHFAVVVKSPCLAVKYPHGGTTIRRLQIKFTTERDYFAALTLLGEINCPLTEGKSPAPAIRRVPSVSSWTSGHLSSIVPRTANTVATSTGSNGALHLTGPLGSGRTTPIRASSPANTIISHPLSRLGSLPITNHIIQSVESGESIQALQAPITLSQPSNREIEPPSSQLSAVSATHDIDQLNQMLPPKRDLPFQKPVARKRRAVGVTESTQNAPQPAQSPNPQPIEQPSNSDPHPTPLRGKPDTCGLHEPNSQLLSQPNPGPEASQPLSLHEELPAAQNKSLINYPSKQGSQAPVAENASQTQHNPINSNLNMPNKPNDEASATTEDHLARYLSSPTSERIAFLQNWMGELLEDDKFLALCRDVDGTWKRFVLGQKR